MSLSAKIKKQKMGTKLEKVWNCNFFPSKRKSTKYQSDSLIYNQIKTSKSLVDKLHEQVKKYLSKDLNDNNTMKKVNALYKLTQQVEMIVKILEQTNIEIFQQRKNANETTNEQDQEPLIKEEIQLLQKKVERIAEENISEKLKLHLENLNNISDDEITYKFKPLNKNSIFSEDLISFLSLQTELLTKSPISSKMESKEKTKKDTRKMILNQPFHQVHLSKPSNFVDRNVLENVSLPWKTEQNLIAGDFDMMRGSLEKLRRRIHEIYSKIVDAAEKSEFSSNSFVQNNNRELTKIRRIMNSTSSENTFRTGLQSNVAETTFITDSHSKQNGRQIYPRDRSNWCKMEPTTTSINKHIQLVNQGNLKERTKLRFFVSKRPVKRNLDKDDIAKPPKPLQFQSHLCPSSPSKDIELNNIHQERLQEISKRLTTSSRVQERIYSARACASLGSADPQNIIYTLCRAFNREPINCVRYEICKSLILLGKWNRGIEAETVTHLQNGSKHIQTEILRIIVKCKTDDTSEENICKSNHDLIKTLHDLLQKSDLQADEDIVCYSAVCLSKIGCKGNLRRLVKFTLTNILQTTSEWKHHSISLEALICQLSCFDKSILHSCLRQLFHAINWHDRLLAIQLIGLFTNQQLQNASSENEIFNTLIPKLWDEAKSEVRLGVSQTLTKLGLRIKLIAELDKLLESGTSDNRSHAVVAISAVGIKNEKTLRILIEMLALDSSDYVKLQIMKTFEVLCISDVRAIRALEEKQKSESCLSSEATKVLESIKNKRLIRSSSTYKSLNSSKS